jgi:hypothetical protein
MLPSARKPRLDWVRICIWLGMSFVVFLCIAMALAYASWLEDRMSDAGGDPPDVVGQLDDIGARLARLQVEADWAMELRLMHPLPSKWQGTRASCRR